MKKWLVLLLLAGIAAAIGWGILRKNEPPKVNFARVKRQSLVSLLPTNGKVEPFEWQAVHCEAAGIVSSYGDNSWMAGFPGMMDNVRLYGETLSASDIANLYANKQ